MDMEEEIVVSPETEALLKKRLVEGCVPCGYILSDWKANAKLTGTWPPGFTLEAKLKHIEQEKANP